MKFYKEELSRLESELEQLSLENLNVYNSAEKGITLCRDSLAVMRARVLKKGFPSNELECFFFKSIKPKVVSHLVHFVNMVSLQRNMPIGGGKEKHKFYLERIKTFRNYFFEHREFYEYHIRGLSHNDVAFFTRNTTSLEWYCANITSIVDTAFSTSKDMVLGQILGNTLTIDYLKQKLWRKKSKVFTTAKSTASLKWTGSKVDLVELIYALEASGMVNNGNVEIKELATALEQLFSIEVGNYYRTFLEIRMRKSSQSKLLDTLKISLTNKISEADN